ncbi:MAG: TolC family protein [Nitrospirota bacterium]
MVEEVRERNPEIRALRNRVKAKEFKAKAEGLLDDPTFKVEIEDIPIERPLNLGDSMQTRYTLGQMLPFPGKLSLRERIAFKEALMAEAEAREKELEVIGMLKEVYYEYAFIVESIKITREIKDVLENVLRNAEVRYSLGQMSQQDVIKAQMEISILVNDILTLEAEKDVTQARLNALLNRDTPSLLPEPEEIPRERIDMSVEELIKRAIDKNPRLRAMAYEIEAQEAMVSLAARNYYPDLMLGIGLIRREGRFDSWDLMASINIPLWLSKYNNQVREAKANRDVSASRLKAEKNLKTFEVREAVIKVERAERVRRLYETGLLPQAELYFSSTLSGYQTGKVNLLTLLDNERLIKKTKIEYLRSIVDYNKGIASLEKVMGGEIGK